MLMDPQPHGGLATSAIQDIERLWQVVMSELADASREAYTRDAEAFRLFLKAPSIRAAAASLISAGPVGGNAMIASFRMAQQEDGKAPATVARRIASLRRLVRVARILGFCSWTVEVRPPKVIALKDTAGPGPDRVASMMEAAQAQEDESKAARDTAILHLLYDLGLRRGEVAAIQFPRQVNVDGKGRGEVWIKGKGRSEPQPIPIGRGTADALRSWIAVRGDWEGALFVRLDNASPDDWREPLSGSAIYDLVRELGHKLGFRTRPHGLRHTAITQVLESTNGDMRTAKKFSRHQKFDMVERYDDNRKAVTAEVSTMLSEDLKRRRRPA